MRERIVVRVVIIQILFDVDEAVEEMLSQFVYRGLAVLQFYYGNLHLPHLHPPIRRWICEDGLSACTEHFRIVGRTSIEFAPSSPYAIGNNFLPMDGGGVNMNVSAVLLGALVGIGANLDIMDTDPANGDAAHRRAPLFYTIMAVMSGIASFTGDKSAERINQFIPLSQRVTSAQGYLSPSVFGSRFTPCAATAFREMLPR